MTSARACPACDETRATPAFTVDGFAHVRCTACGTVFVSPLPTMEVVQATYLQPDYHETAEASAARMRSEAEARVAIMAAMGVRRIVEVGCGPGHFLDAARDAGMHIEGIDPARTAVDAIDRGHVVHRTWLEAFTPDQPFDALALWEVLEHLPRPAEALAHMRRWLRPRAVVALSTPSMSGVPARLLGARFPMVTPPDHLELFSERGLRHLLARADLVPERWTSFSNLGPDAIARGLRRLPLVRHAGPLVDAVARLAVAPARWIDRAGLGTSFEVYARASIT
jgi:2-polyprenyl-3-methyl-5-hydroxy-6-metoxy-1,4-benzoquinol methylase